MVWASPSLATTINVDINLEEKRDVRVIEGVKDIILDTRGSSDYMTAAASGR